MTRRSRRLFCGNALAILLFVRDHTLDRVHLQENVRDDYAKTGTRNGIAKVLLNHVWIE
jgi:hypothetical protein